VAEQTYRVTSTATVELAPAERADFWSEHVTRYHCRLDYRYARPAGFRGGTIHQRTAAYQLVDFWSDAIRYVRTPGQVRRDPDEDYRFLVPTRGEMVVRQDNRETGLTPGRGTLFTPAAPFELLHDSSAQALIMTIPGPQIDGPLARTSPLAAGLDLTAGLGAVVGRMMTGLAAEQDRLTCVQFDGVCDRIVELLCMLVVGDDRPDAPDQLAEVEALVRGYVRRRAADSELTGATVARELGWSLRQVQLALQRAGTTPRDLIRDERLRLVNERLCDPAYQRMSITEVGQVCGFSSASALSTAFRRRYGVSPREMRRGTGPVWGIGRDGDRTPAQASRP
jgi:AraC-like DNA-binding protein